MMLAKSNLTQPGSEWSGTILISLILFTYVPDLTGIELAVQRK